MLWGHLLSQPCQPQVGCMVPFTEVPLGPVGLPSSPQGRPGLHIPWQGLWSEHTLPWLLACPVQGWQERAGKAVLGLWGLPRWHRLCGFTWPVLACMGSPII